MDALTITFAVLALLGLVGVLWLLAERSRLLAERDLARARIADEERARESFEAVAGSVLRSSNEEFLRLAKEAIAAGRSEATAVLDQRKTAVDELVKPIREALHRTHEELKQMGKERAGLHEQVRNVVETNAQLRAETGKLVQALRKPNVRGRYGEIQLERVVELAGMRAYCDFSTQTHLKDDGDGAQRPDMVVKLPNDRHIAVDAKTSIDAYLDAIDASSPEEADALLERYAQHVFDQAQKLASRRYWERFQRSPDLVVMFIPADQLVDAALERRPQLIELAAENNVVIASPSTLIGLLRAVHVGWREKNLTENAEELFVLGQELHRRAAIVLEHAAKVGQAIDGARRRYNEFVGSVQGRLLPHLRKFEEHDARSTRELVELPPIDGEARDLGDIEPPAPMPERARESSSDLFGEPAEKP